MPCFQCKLLGLLLTLLFLSFSSKAQVIEVGTNIPKTHITIYNSDNGLIQNTVRQTIFDQSGFLWIISEKGLTRFNGRDFKHFINKKFEKELSQNRINHMTSIEGKVIINGFPQLYLQNGQFIHDSSALFLKDTYIGYRNQFINNSNFRFLDTILSVKVNHEVSFHERIKSSFLYINDSCIYVKNEKGGLDYIQNGQLISQLPREYDYPYDYKPDGTIQKVSHAYHAYFERYFVQNDKVFFLTLKNTLRIYSKGKLSNEYQFNPPLQDAKLLWQSGHPPAIVSNKTIYFIQEDKGKYTLEPQVKLPEVTPKNILSFENNILFIGTRLNGLYKVKTQGFKTHFLPSAGMRNNDRSLFEVGEDSILTAKGLLYTPTGQFDVMDTVEKLTIRDSAFYYLIKRTQGGSDPVGLRYGEKSEQRWWSGFYLKGKNDQLYFGGKNGVLQIIDKKCNLLYSDSTVGLKPFLGAFYDPYQNSIWRTFQNITEILFLNNNELKVQQQFTGLDIKNVHFENDSSIWFCVREKGLMFWNRNKLFTFPTDKRMALQSCHAIVEDDFGFFWISTDQGILKVRKSDLLRFKNGQSNSVYYHHFDKKNGFLTNEFNGGGVPCGLKHKNGKISFPSLKGVVTFDPKEIYIESSGSELSIGNIRIDGHDTTLNFQNGIDQGFEHLEFSILYAFFGDAENLILEYKVKGLHQNWHPVPGSNAIRLPNISYGNYELIVRRKNGFSVNGYSYLNFKFKINPKFHETAAFRISIILILILILIGAFYFISWYAKQQRLRLEHIIKEKTHDQLVLNEELKLNLAKLRKSDEEQKISTETKNRFMAIYTHDVRGPLRFIQTITKSSLKRLGKIEEDDLRLRLEDIEQSTHRIYMLTERMFHWLRSQKDEVQLKEESFLLSDFAAHTINLFKDQASLKNTVFNSNFGSPIKIRSEKNVLSIILSNILDNAIKYTVNGTISVAIHKLTDNAVISVTDTGTGINKEKLEEIRSGVYLSVEGTNGEQGTGFGLRTIKELIIMIGGFIEINSEEGKGASVSVFLPLKT